MAKKGKQYEIVTPVVRAGRTKWLQPGEVDWFTEPAASILLKRGVIKPIKEQAKAPKSESTEE
jgi:hypothetical protein